MLVNAFIAIVFIGILASLGSALLFMIRDGGKGERTVRALSFRIGISVGLFLLLMVLSALGIIEPHGLGG
ncbi:MAG: hypothetical protein ACI9W2_000774 [Gammaproteobacteria bacterium]|jgi:hypothetical protein